MIKGLFETHLFVEDLERSIDFYQNVLGLTKCGYNDERRIAFFWIGEPKAAMLGLWEKPKEQIDIRHFAFRCDVDYVLNRSVAFLKARNLQPYNFLKDGNEKPMVFAWMPAIAIYFKDPDGHDLEFIAILEGEGQPDLGVVSYEDWLENKVSS
ncbi:MAG: VOC family protein [Pedobacter sp.]|nr:MAG: VOC family protein [Pedobacter sp.]